LRIVDLSAEPTPPKQPLRLRRPEALAEADCGLKKPRLAASRNGRHGARPRASA